MQNNYFKRLRRAIVTSTTLLSVFLWMAPLVLPAQQPPKAIVVAWDGAVPSFVHEMLRQNKLPNLAKLIAGGTFADDVTPSFPSFTAPGFASLWTGASPPVNGISGNRVPRLPQSQYTILESRLGFSHPLLLAEPLWTVAQRVGRRVVVTHFPFGGEKSDLGVHLQGYGGIAGRDGIVTAAITKPRPATNWRNPPSSDRPSLELQFTVGSTTFFGLLVDDRSDPQSGYDTLLVTRNKNAQDPVATLKGGVSKPGRPVSWSGVIDVKTSDGQSAQCYFRLFELRSDGSDFLLYHTRLAREMVFPPDLLPQARAHAGAFIGNGAGQIYGQGGFGPTIPKGGSGIAESRYLETVVFTQRQLMRTNSWAVKNLPWDLFFAYTPFPDEAEHRWRGHLDLNLPGARRETVERLRPLLEEVYRTCDEFLGLLMENRPDNTILVLVSDHGMEGVNKSFGINRALKMGGLLGTDDRGRVDLAKTKVFYPSINNGYLLINSANRKNGRVTAEERADLVRAIRELFLSIRDGDRQVVTAIYDPDRDGKNFGIGGLTGGDVYVDLAPGYDFDWRTNAGDIIVQREPHGMHGFNPRRPSMRTLMVFNGPGVASGRRLRDVHLIDFAPTLANLLGLPAPKDATGRILLEAFSAPR